MFPPAEGTERKSSGGGTPETGGEGKGGSGAT